MFRRSTRSKKISARNQLRRAPKVARPMRSVYQPYSVRGTNPNNSSVFTGKGFPDSLTTNLVYSDSIILDPTAANPLPKFSYRLTSLFDPQFTLGGGQPTYFDQLAGLYERYIVNGAKITCIFSRSSTTAANIGPYICGVSSADNDTVPATAAATLMSAPNTVFKVVSQDGGNQTVTQTYSRFKTYGAVGAMDNGLQARTTTDPTTNWFANVWASPQGVDVEAPINVVVIIEYNATFTGVKDIIDA